MRKFLILMLITLLVFSLVGCDNSNEVVDDGDIEESKDVEFKVDEEENLEEPPEEAEDEIAEKIDEFNFIINDQAFELTHPSIENEDLLSFFYLTPEEIFEKIGITKDYLEGDLRQVGNYDEKAYLVYEELVLFFESLEDQTDLNKKNLLEISGQVDAEVNLSLNLSNGNNLTKGNSIKKIRDNFGEEFMLQDIYDFTEFNGKEMTYILGNYDGEFSNDNQEYDTIQLVFKLKKGTENIEFIRIGLANNEKLVKEKNIEDMSKADDEGADKNVNKIDRSSFEYNINGKGFKVKNPNINISNLVDLFSYTNKEFLNLLGYPDDYLESGAENVGEYGDLTSLYTESVIFHHTIESRKENKPGLVKFSGLKNHRVNLEVILENGTRIIKGMKDTEVIDILGDEHYYGPTYDEEERIIGEELNYVIKDYDKDFYTKNDEYSKMLLVFNMDYKTKTVKYIGVTLEN